jgi:Ca2+-binding EF-hand superfamily protein
MLQYSSVRRQERGFAITRRNLLIALLSVTALVGTAVPQKASVPKQPSKESLGEENVKELLLLMDTDKTGKISKQEWMKFMEVEFDRLDKDRKGELDWKELMQSRVSVKKVRFADTGK